jgi:hypothetical protein
VGLRSGVQPLELAQVREIARQFDIPGSFLSVSVIRSGHINDTYLSSFQAGQKLCATFTSASTSMSSVSQSR